MLKINYDNKFDILYISIENPVPSYGEEEIPGLVILRSIETDELTGVTIFDFIKKVNNNKINELKMPIEIDINDISNKIQNIKA